jgi:hypothetical protein
MVHIEITKQPLYGTVYWNGNDFIYTPRAGFSGNDIYYYTKNENGIITSHKNYVNTSNLAPIARNLTLSADAYNRTTIDITELVIDETNPFNDLKIISIDNPVKGRIENNGNSLYYYPIALNTVEHLTYVVSDRQYSTTGTLTLSVTNGRVQLPLENTNFKYILTRDYNIANTIPALAENWNSAFNTLDNYKDSWNSADFSKYVDFSNYIESLSSRLNQIYSTIPVYDGLYLIVNSNSATWINNTDIIYYVSNTKQNLINTYNILSSKNITWNNDYNNYFNISGSINNSIDNINSTHSTITANSVTNWDSNELYNALENNRYNWDTTYQVVCASNKPKEWTDTITPINYITPVITADSINFTNLYNLITANSSTWGNQETENVMVSSNKWNSVYSSYNSYNNLYNILIANSGIWINDRNQTDSIYNILSSNSANWDNLYNILTGNYGTLWNNTSYLNNTLINAISVNNSTHSTVTANSGLWDSNDLNTYLSISSNLIDTYNKVSTLSAPLNQLYTNLTSVSTDFYNNINILNSYTNLVSSNSSLWNDIINFENSVSLSTINWNEVSNNKNNYDNLYSILYSNSSTWYSNVNELTSISAFIFEKSPIWDSMYYLVFGSDWFNSAINYQKLSSAIGINNILFDNLYNTITANSGKWASADFYQTKLSAISSWDSVYDTVITKNKYNLWNNAVTDLSTLSSTFYTTGSSLNVLNDKIQNSLYIWDNKIGSTILTGNSANWINSYSTVTAYSANWFFNDTPEYLSTYSYVSGISANLQNLSTFVSNNSSAWDNIKNGLTPTLTSQFLTGSETINLSTNNLSVIGTTHILGNLSALGGKFSIDTTLNTTSGFTINNSDNNDAVVIDKVGGGAILNLYMADSPVLYVKATPKTVGINLSAISNVIGDVNNISLTVSGNISATGIVYPIPQALTLYSSKSAAYESAFTYLTTNSAAIDSFISDTKPVYDSMVSYIINGNTNGTISSFSAVTIPYYNTYLDKVNEYSNKLTQTNNYISLCGNVLDVDTVFSANSSKYEQTYNHINNSINTSRYVISHFFGHNVVLSSQKVNVVVSDNIKIQSWQLYSDTLNSTLSVDILSTTHSNYGKLNNPISITNGNPPYLTTSDKNSATNLDSSWVGTYLPKGSILQFNLINTNISPVSGLLVNLIVQKQ